MSNLSKGLYVVSTPIGNLEDITFRAVRVLKEVDYILCEDTRITQKLLFKLNISTRMVSFHRFNEYDFITNILDDLKLGRLIALVSDAGTPLISDPGFYLVSEARKKNINVYSIPGPCALVSAISVSGKITGEFLFLGFLPSDRSKRLDIIKSLRSRSSSIVFYVGPHDLKKYLAEIAEVYPTVQIFISREVTKIYEEYLEGNILEVISLISNRDIKGEIVLGLVFNENEIFPESISDSDLVVKVKHLLDNGFSLKEAGKILSLEYHLSVNYIYNVYIKSKN